MGRGLLGGNTGIYGNSVRRGAIPKVYCIYKTNVREDKMLFTIFGFLGCFRGRGAVLQVGEVYCINKFMFFLLLETGSLQCLYYSHFCPNNGCICPGRRCRVLT